MGIFGRVFKWVLDSIKNEPLEDMSWNYFEKVYERTGTSASYILNNRLPPHKQMEIDLDRYIKLLPDISGSEMLAIQAIDELQSITVPSKNRCSIMYQKYMGVPIPVLGPFQSVTIYYGKRWAIAVHSYTVIGMEHVDRIRVLKFAIRGSSLAVQFRLMMD